MVVRLNEFITCIQQMVEHSAIVTVYKRATSGEPIFLNSYQIAPGSNLIEEIEYGEAIIVATDLIDPKEIKIVINTDY